MKLTKTAYFYLNDEELALLDKKAKNAGFTRSEYLRKCLREAEMLPTLNLDFQQYVYRLSEVYEKARIVADKLWHKVCFDVPLLMQAAKETTDLMFDIKADIFKEKERLKCEEETTELL